MKKLVLLRHGQSQWNLENKFTGWVDVDLTEKGEEEERKAEKRRKESGRMPPRGDKRREDFEKWYAANVR